ncbi:MAG: hypothetical protein K0U29_04115 [Gammaproteobacteria bacterium]|nr:hypothetical protein [Gammaproteobacteria bacterium]
MSQTNEVNIPKEILLFIFTAIYFTAAEAGLAASGATILTAVSEDNYNPEVVAKIAALTGALTSPGWHHYTHKKNAETGSSLPFSAIFAFITVAGLFGSSGYLYPETMMEAFTQSLYSLLTGTAALGTAAAIGVPIARRCGFFGSAEEDHKTAKEAGAGKSKAEEKCLLQKQYIVL